MSVEIEGIMAALECSEDHARGVLLRLLHHGWSLVPAGPGAPAESLEPMPAMPLLPGAQGTAAASAWNVGIAEAAEAKDSL